MLKTFPKGGVHPPENKISAGAAIETLPLPTTATIPISQHLGAPSAPTVKKGDKVKVGQIIAQSTGFVSTNIHSSVSGTVQKIDDSIDASGYKRKAVIISVEGDEWDENIDRSPELKKEFSLSGPDIIKKVLENGVVGLGGATFPTHVKLSVPKGMKADVLILNGVECEPYLTSDHRIMLEKADEIIVGTQILMKALDVKKALIGIENNKPDAIEVFSKLADKNPGIEVHPLKVQYPQGGEKQLIKALINREVPSGGLPIAVGAVVQNVGTALAVYEAVQKNKPLIERVVSLTGKSVKKPANYLVRIGTPVAELIEASGGLPDDTGKVINGGPMMGKALNSLEVPVTKGTSGILIIPELEARRRPVQNCIRCARCTQVCPMGLEPYLLMTLTQKSMWDKVETNHALDCIECGSCAYTCPADRPLLDYIRLGKTTVSKLIRARKQ
ncbi:MAG: electron transport complex subunit RsxC [Bacteroidales bacterium]|nr:electron transport complex subunit RsxC [Bacteroidales bacterium]MCF8458884.1 electron transport complex subunit RsxC [Bacteroidales bacterium]